MCEGLGDFLRRTLNLGAREAVPLSDELALVDRYLAGRQPLLESRARAGVACDGHGDLIADDIFCLPDGPRVLDCLEFDDRLRWVDALDDAAFLYWIRTVPLEIGKRYEYRRYFRPERNPVIVEVLGRERVGVAGRKWNAIVIRPRIPNGGGIFAERADARMWLSDDDRRVMLALQSNFSFGQVTMKLKEYSDPPAGRP